VEGRVNLGRLAKGCTCNDVPITNTKSIRCQLHGIVGVETREMHIVSPFPEGFWEGFPKKHYIGLNESITFLAVGDFLLLDMYLQNVIRKLY